MKHGAELVMRMARRGVGAGVRRVVKQRGPYVKLAGDSEWTLTMSQAAMSPFVGAALPKVLAPARELMQCDNGANAFRPLAVHTSVGTPTQVDRFINTLADHLPFNPLKNPDWFVDLQVEGASGVHAAIEELLNRQPEHRQKVAVSSAAYHGPRTTSHGTGSWLDQLVYPAPVANHLRDRTQIPQLTQDAYEAYLRWLDEHADELGVILFEPQWGTSALAQPWHPPTLRKYVAAARERGVGTVADEVMCGMWRHGRGTMFLSRAINLEADAYVTSKGLGAGVFPLAVALFREGGADTRIVQKHTFAGASAPAFATATAMLEELPKYAEQVQRYDALIRTHFLAPMVQLGFRPNGQGLLWGVPLLADELRIAKIECGHLNVAPYFIEGNGVLITPPFDIEEPDLIEGCSRLVRAFSRVSQAIP